MPVTGLGSLKPSPSTIPSVPEDVALRFEPVFPDAHRPSIQQGTLLACLDLLAPDSCATPVRICGDAVWGVVYCLARALHSEDLRTWCSARASQRLVLRRVRGGVLRPP